MAFDTKATKQLMLIVITIFLYSYDFSHYFLVHYSFSVANRQCEYCIDNVSLINILNTTTTGFYPVFQ